MRLVDADKLHPDVMKVDGSMAISQGQLAHAKTVEAIPKDQYETRLKADLKAILVELQLEIEEMDSGCGWEGYRPTAQVIGLIQQKINALKAEKGAEQ